MKMVPVPMKLLADVMSSVREVDAFLSLESFLIESMQFRKWLRKARRQKKMTIRQAAKAIDVSHLRWASWELGVAKPLSWVLIEKIAKELGASVTDIEFRFAKKTYVVRWEDGGEYLRFSKDGPHWSKSLAEARLFYDSDKAAQYVRVYGGSYWVEHTEIVVVKM